MVRIAFCLLGVGLVSLCGCGGKNLTKVSGTVTLDGEPVPNAVVSFVPDIGEGSTYVGSTDSSGKYMIASSQGIGVPPGAYSVQIKEKGVAASGGGDDPFAGLAEGSPEYIAKYQEMMAGGNQAKNYKPAKDAGAGIPAKYNSGAELKALVEGSSQTIDFALSKN